MPSWRVLPAARRRTGEGEEGGGKFGTTTHGEEEEREKVGSSRECRSGRDTREKKEKGKISLKHIEKKKTFRVNENKSLIWLGDCRPGQFMW